MSIHRTMGVALQCDLIQYSTRRIPLHTRRDLTLAEDFCPLLVVTDRSLVLKIYPVLNSYSHEAVIEGRILMGMKEIFPIDK